VSASEIDPRCRCCHVGQPCECCRLHAGDRTRDELIARIATEATTYGPTWQTSTLIAEVRRRLASVELHLVDGAPDAARVAAVDAAALAIALAARLHEEGNR